MSPLIRRLAAELADKLAELRAAVAAHSASCGADQAPEDVGLDALVAGELPAQTSTCLRCGGTVEPLSVAQSGLIERCPRCRAGVVR